MSPRDSTRRTLRRILYEPLTHFVLVGAVIFAFTHEREEPVPDSTGSFQRIEVSTARVDQLRNTWASQNNRMPTGDELASLIEGYVKEEVLYREALKLGLDQEDPIVRRRLAQKLQFLMEDLFALPEPDEESLLAYYEEHAARYTLAERISFEHIYFSPDRQDNPDSAALEALDELAADEKPVGDPFPLQAQYAGQTSRDLAILFGGEFAETVCSLEPGKWHGPIRSGYGTHLVKVNAKRPSKKKTFDVVREDVVRDWTSERRAAKNREIYENLRKQYDVVIAESGAEP